MSFDNDLPNRKDRRKPYRKSKRWDRSCRNHGSWVTAVATASTARSRGSKRQRSVYQIANRSFDPRRWECTWLRRSRPVRAEMSRVSWRVLHQRAALSTTPRRNSSTEHYRFVDGYTSKSRLRFIGGAYQEWVDA
jgi:hypothetical protein